MKKSKNIKLLRGMLNTEVNSAMFNPDVKDHTPINIIIIIENEDGHIHCIKPDNNKISKRMLSVVLDREEFEFLRVVKD